MLMVEGWGGNLFLQVIPTDTIGLGGLLSADDDEVQAFDLAFPDTWCSVTAYGRWTSGFACLVVGGATVFSVVFACNKAATV